MPTPSAPIDATPGAAHPCGNDGTAAANGLETERQRLREILGRMPDHVILFGRDERIEYVNPAMVRVLGVPAGTLIGRLPAELGFGGPEMDPFRLEFRRVLETGEPVTGEQTDPGLWGGRSFSYTMTPLSGPDGRVASVMLTSRDVTPLIRAQAALAESEAKYRNLVELSPDAILIHQDGAIVFANPAAVAMLGYDRPEDLLGRPVLEIVHPCLRGRVESNIGMDLRGEESPVTVVDLLRRDGTTVAAQGRGAMIPFGGRFAVQVVLRDVTEEKRAEAALRESEDRFRRTFDQSPVGAALLLPDFTILRANTALCRMLGYSEEELQRMRFPEFTHPDDVDEDVRLGTELASGAIDQYELDKRFIRRDGAVVWGHLSERYIRDAEGRVTYLVPMVQDITERRQAEEALRESEGRLRLAKACAGIGNWEWHLPEISGPGSSEHVRLYDPGPETVVIDDWRSTVHPDDFERVEAERDAALARHEPFELEFRYDDGSGSIRWMRVLGGGVFDGAGRLLRVLGVNMDITAQKRAEEALRESEERLRLAQEGAGIGIWDRDAVTDRVTITPGFLRRYGLEAEAITCYADWVRLIHPDDREQVEAGRQAAFAAGTPLELEFRVVLPQGEVRWIQFKGHRVADGRGALDRVIGVLIDVTERRRTEEAVREREQTLQSIFRAAPVGIGMVSHRVITQANDQLCRMTGYTRDELIGRDARMFYPSDEAYDYVGREKYAQIMAGGTGAVETQWRRRDGTLRDILLSSSPVDLSRPQEDVVFNALDITRLRESERALESYMDDLQRSNEELQRFAYVASHDLQEPLRSIISFSQLLEKKYRGRLDADADEYIAFIVEGGNRMQTLIQDLLQLSRVETKAKPLVPTDAGEVAADALRLMETSIREAEATVTVEDLPTVMADAAQLEQVFTNLVGNALKYRRPDVPPEVRVSAEREDGFWRFSVADNGIGIEEQYFDRIFVIFQRLHTRDEYEGTGIGLAVVRKIVERHGGRIAVESTPGQGSTFYFTLLAA